MIYVVVIWILGKRFKGEKKNLSKVKNKSERRKRGI